MSISLLPAQLTDAWVAFPADVVQEIVGQHPWIAIPSAPPEVPGVLAWRGRAIAVLDLGLMSGISPPLKRGELRRRTMVLHVEGCTFAVSVDEVREVQQVAGGDVQPAEVTKVRYSAGEVVLDGTPMPLLDVLAMVRAVSVGGDAR
ncbi:MAG TPA: chemotaxis protein CheW [Polyangia bacterium]